MKCITNGNKTIIYVQDTNIKITQFDDIEFVEEYFKSLFLRLKENYQIHLNGFYIIDVYIDKIYGMIIEMKEEDIDYIDYYDDTIDMKTSVHSASFLYQVKDILNLYHFKDLEFYLYQNQYYLKIKDNVDNIKLSEILEYVENIIYKDTDLIIKRAKKL